MSEVRTRDEPQLSKTVTAGAHSEPHVPGPIPRDFGDYVIESEIGRGGMGIVYRARQKSLDRPVAIKIVFCGPWASAEQLSRFRGEARAAARARHPNVVAIYEAGEAHGTGFIAMELVEGTNLDERSRAEPWSFREAARVVATVARAVDCLHVHGIVHRDLKPSNILLDRTGRPVVTDFGLARLFDEERGLTRSGLAVGTPGYMAPEQAAAKTTEIGPPSDVYGLGAVLFHLLTGRAPFAGETPLETLLHVLERQPPSPTSLRAGVPFELEAIVLKCLEKNPAERYPSAGAVAADLERFLRAEPVEARAPRPWKRLTRWARREPAFSARLLMLGSLLVLELIWYHLLGATGPGFHATILVLVPLWILGSVVLKRVVRRSRRSEAWRYVWAILDATFLTAVLLATELGVSSSLVAALPVFVVASGLWFRVRLVWFSTALALLGYGVLAWADQGPNARDLADHVTYLIATAVLGVIVSYQVRRFRVLSRYAGG